MYKARNRYFSMHQNTAANVSRIEKGGQNVNIKKNLLKIKKSFFLKKINNKKNKKTIL